MIIIYPSNHPGAVPNRNCYQIKELLNPFYAVINQHSNYFHIENYCLPSEAPFCQVIQKKLNTKVSWLIKKVKQMWFWSDGFIAPGTTA